MAITDAAVVPQSASTLLSITTAPPPAPVQITTVSLPVGQAQSAYTAMLTASGGTPPYTWSVFGQLPPGLSLAASTGSITGTLTTTGLSAFTIQVADSGPQTASAQFSINITAGGAAEIHHVFIVVLENHNYADVIGNAAMPYLNGLASQNGLATQFYANTHPSIGNYFWMTTGQPITEDDSFSGTVSVDNAVRQLIAAGRTWKGYAETLPSVGWTGGDSGLYSEHHFPLSYFSDVRNDPAQTPNLVPFTQFATDLASGTLPNYSLIVPNKCSDAHDCGLDVADAWLSTNIGPLLNNPIFQTDSLVVITFDESHNDNTLGGGRIATVLLGPAVKKQFQSTTTYQWQSMLRLSLEALGVSSWPGAAATAPSMAEFFTLPLQ